MFLQVLKDDGAQWRFGLGTTQANFDEIISNIPPFTSLPSAEVFVGQFNAGETVHFGMFTTFIGDSAWAFSNRTDVPSRNAFTDEDNSLGFGGSVIEQESPTTWLMHLDNAVSFLYDDDDNDIVLRLRLEVPGGGSSGTGASFVVPFDGNLYLQAIGGEAAASGRADFGLAARGKSVLFQWG